MGEQHPNQRRFLITGEQARNLVEFFAGHPDVNTAQIIQEDGPYTPLSAKVFASSGRYDCYIAGQAR